MCSSRCENVFEMSCGSCLLNFKTMALALILYFINEDSFRIHQYAFTHSVRLRLG